MKESTRVIINTFAQYVRTILNMILLLYATRVILRTLGVEDYGIYSVVAGVVSMLSFLTSSLIITTQRFLSVAQGHNNIVKSRIIFNNSFFLHVIIAVAFFFVLETLGLFLFHGFLNIPSNKIDASLILFHYVTLSLILTVLLSPFKAVLVSHENIVYISIIEVFDALFKLIIAYVLFFFPNNKLSVYGFFLFLIQLFNFFTIALYAFYKFDECRRIKLADLSLSFIKKMFSFAGWTMYNLICNLGRNQGIAIGLNVYLGPVVNAAYGLAFQVSGTLSNISQSLMNAINPQLMKAEGAGNRRLMLRIAEVECKFGYFLLSAFAIPCVFEINRLLEIWLGQVPAHAVLFCRMVILAAIVDTLTSGLGSANQAEGRIKNYTLAISSVKLLTLPIVLLILYFKADLVWILFVYVFLEFVTSLMRIPFLGKTAKLDIKGFIKKVFMKELIPTVIIIISCSIISFYFDSSYRFVFTFLLSVFLYAVSVFFWGLCSDEKKVLLAYFKKTAI